MTLSHLAHVTIEFTFFSDLYLMHPFLTLHITITHPNKLCHMIISLIRVDGTPQIIHGMCISQPSAIDCLVVSVHRSYSSIDSHIFGVQILLFFELHPGLLGWGLYSGDQSELAEPGALTCKA